MRESADAVRALQRAARDHRASEEPERAREDHPRRPSRGGGSAGTLPARPRGRSDSDPVRRGPASGPRTAARRELGRGRANRSALRMGRLCVGLRDENRNSAVARAPLTRALSARHRAEERAGARRSDLREDALLRNAGRQRGAVTETRRSGRITGALFSRASERPGCRRAM